MANTFFQFKQFTIQQEKSAMKVCTDSCIFGAAIHVNSSKTLLDIGTGTGLLALMAAQRSTAKIDAIEIDQLAAEEANHNFSNSPWSNRLSIHHTSIQEFQKVHQTKYDVIISNPPFFTDSLLSANASKNKALHQTDLTFEALLDAVLHFLSAEGRFIILLPAYEAELFREEALDRGLFVSAVLKIRDNKASKTLREITEFKRELSFPSQTELIIKNEAGEYTEGFKSLLKDYYLHL